MLKYNQVSYQEILSDISFEIVPGTITTFIGGNGSGKSTLISLLKNRSFQGGITYEDEIYDFKRHYSKISILKQETKLSETLTVREFLNLGMQAKRGIFKRARIGDTTFITTLLTKCELLDLEHKLIKNLSGGEKQRVLIAFSLIKQPKLLILDEPTTFLDIKYQKHTLNLIEKLNKEDKVTIILILHDINQAIKISDHIIMLKNGRILADLQPEDIDETKLKACFDIEFERHYKAFIAA